MGALPRPCLDCPRISTQLYRGRCKTCAAKREKQRGTRQARGYGPAHQQARAHLATTLPKPCAYGCGTILTPTGPWVAAHVVDGDPTQGWIASCPRCNEQAKR